MKKIRKTPIGFNTDGKFFRELPHMAKILSLQMQENVPVIWHLSDTDETIENLRFFQWFPADASNIRDNSIYIGTVQLRNGLVFHLFEL